MIVLIALVLSVEASDTFAQGPGTDAQTASPASEPHADKNSRAPLRQQHRFWDKENAWLFAGVGASRTFDYFSTLNLRRRGDHEILGTNDLVDNHPAFSVVEAAGTWL